MLFEDTYLTIEKNAESLFKDRSSRFIGLAFPVHSEPEIKAMLSEIKKKYFDATHHCYAFRLGFDKSAFRSNDDGEPAGTAGKPILGQIQSKDLTNVLVVVVRYYGGTKLGVSGLINAYKTSAKEVLENAIIVKKTISDVYQLTFNYEQMNDVMRIMKEDSIQINSQQFDNSCVINFSVRKQSSDRIAGLIEKVKNTTLIYLFTN